MAQNQELREQSPQHISVGVYPNSRIKKAGLFQGQEDVYAGKSFSQVTGSVSEFWEADSWFPQLCDAIRGASLIVQYVLVPLQ